MVDGMTEVLIAELARNRSLRVVSRTTVMQFKDSRSPIRQIARELGADAIIEGSVLLAGSSARITAQLIRAETDEHRWAESYQREVRDVLALQSEVARAIAEEIKKVALRRDLSLRVAARPGDADSLARRLRPCGRGDAAGVRGGGPSNGPGTGFLQNHGVARFDRAIQGHRCGSSPCSAGRVTQTRGSLSRGMSSAPTRCQTIRMIEDDRLRLIFTCCHPALPKSTQVALTLREVCGLSTDEIARALLTPPSTVAQRIVRGKAEDSRCRHSLPRSVGGRFAGATRQCAAGDVSGV